MDEHFTSSQRVDPERDFRRLASAIAELATPQPGGSALTAATELRALVALQRRLAGAVLDRLACFDAQGFAVASGCASTAAWVRAYTNATVPAATSLVAAARRTRTLPLLAAELTAGRIGVEHLQAVARATGDVPDEVLAQHDTTLRDVAPHVTAAHLHRAGTTIAEGWDESAAAANENHAQEVRRPSLSQTMHGVWALDGTLTPEAGAKLAAAPGPLMRKRGPEDERTPGQRRADALLELVDIALTSGALPDCGGDRTRITLVVHATEAALDLLQDHNISGVDVPHQTAETHDIDGTGDLHGSGDMHGSDNIDASDHTTANTGRASRWMRSGPSAWLAGGRLAAVFGEGSSFREFLGSHAELTVEALTRLGCDADLALDIMDASGLPLYLSRTSRDPNTAQRRLLVIRDGGCVFPGCDRPPSHCQAHHLKFWTRDQGPTDIDNLALICSFHHWLIHDRRWTLAALPVSPEAPAGGWLAESPEGLTSGLTEDPLPDLPRSGASTSHGHLPVHLPQLHTRHCVRSRGDMACLGAGG